MIKKIFAALAAAGFAAAAVAAVSVDANGVGFVGKGDVQLVYGWNNKGLQDCVNTQATFQNVDSGCLSFQLSTVTTAESTWTCSRINSNNREVSVNRHRNVTTSLQGLASSTARVKQQVTGFFLLGFIGSPTETNVAGGQALMSCPSDNGAQQFTYDDNLDTVTTTSGGGLQVRAYGGVWIDLPNTPVP